ncbi:MAG: hypothetical protein N2746_00710 [Deltaproteobacteria bacterium]|nr:hypothetical protein [Deltaproteobacteria bacterium]
MELVQLEDKKDDLKKSVIEYENFTSLQPNNLFLAKVEDIKDSWNLRIPNRSQTTVTIKSDNKIFENKPIKFRELPKKDKLLNKEVAEVISRIIYIEKADNNINPRSPADKKSEIESRSKDTNENFSNNNYTNIHIGQNLLDITPNYKDISYLSEISVKQDYELVRRMIEEKANRFVPIVYQKKLMEKKRRTAIVEIILNEKGYVFSHIIKKSTGIKEMDKSINAILHLAEPYLYVPKPVDIELVFYE